MPDLIGLVQKTNFDGKISEIEEKYLNTFYYTKFTSEVFKAKIRQKEVVSKSNISNLVKNSD